MASERFENIEGLAALEKALDELPNKIERNIVRGGLRAGSKEFIGEAKRHIHNRSGELAKSLRVSTGKRFGVVSASVKAGGKRAWYAPLVEFGTRAHTITAKIKGALTVQGNLVRQVEHPGSAPHPFMRPAFDLAWRKAVDGFAVYARRRLATLAGLNRPDEGGP